MLRYFFVASMLVLGMAPAGARAQIISPIFDENKNKTQPITFQEASDAGALRHGQRVKLTLSGNTPTEVNGIVVTNDGKNGMLYVRTRPGSAPRGVPIANIKRIETGVIKEAAYSREVNTSEIEDLVIYNGRHRTVAYSAPTLSPSELAHLADLEAAQNELNRINLQARTEEMTVANDLAFQAEGRKTLELANRLLEQRLVLNQTTDVLTLPNGSSYTMNGWGGLSAGGMTDVLLAGIMRLSAAPFANLPKAGMNSESLTAARRNYMAIRSRSVYENGRLVAVLAEDDTNKTPKDR